MIPESLLLAVSVAEAVLVGLTALAVLGSAVRLTLRDRRRRTCKARSIRNVVRAVELEELASDNDVLRSVPSWLQAEVVTELLSTLSGLRRRRLLRLAVEGGMASDGEHMCASRRWTRRLRGAHLLSVLGLSDETLAAMLDDTHPEVRAQAAEGMGDHPTGERVRRLLDLLRDPEPLVRFAGKDALLRIGRPAASPVAEHLSHLREDEVLDALDVAAGLAGPEFLDPALTLSSDARAAVRARAAHLLGAIGGSKSTETLGRMLQDPDAAPRAAAAECVGRLDHWPAAGLLADQLRDPDWSVRRTAALALRDLGAPGLIFLRRALGSEGPYASDIARQALGLPESADDPLAL